MQITIPRLGSGMNPMPKAEGMSVGQASGKTKIMQANVQVSASAVKREVQVKHNELQQIVSNGMNVDVKA